MALGVYAALPPEVNVARLLGGVGAAAMFAVAAGYTAIGQAATALAAASDALVQSVMTTWRGTAADQAIPAFQRHSVWLREFAALAETTAARATTMANAYITAVASSPTIPELVTNRVSLFTLIATNIFGINTPAIGVTETDYMRMWAQAAGAMSTYDAEATASTTLTEPQQAPEILTQLASSLSSLTGPLSSLSSLASTAQDNQSEHDAQRDAHPDSEQLASLPTGLLGTTPGSRMLDELRGEGANVPPPNLIRGGLDAMPGTTGVLVPANWASGAVAGEPAGTRVGAPAATAPFAGAPLGGAPLVSAARPGETVPVPDRHRETAVAVIDVGGDDEEVAGPAST